MDRRLLILAGALGFLGVAAGAFGSHAMAERVSAARLATWDTAVRYLFYHLPLLLFLASGALCEQRAALWAGRFLVAGMIVFSGSLFALVLLDRSWLGAITPIGGVFLLCAWALFLAALRRPVA